MNFALGVEKVEFEIAIELKENKVLKESERVSQKCKKYKDVLEECESTKNSYDVIQKFYDEMLIAYHSQTILTITIKSLNILDIKSNISVITNIWVVNECLSISFYHQLRPSLLLFMLNSIIEVGGI